MILTKWMITLPEQTYGAYENIYAFIGDFARNKVYTITVARSSRCCNYGLECDCGSTPLLVLEDILKLKGATRYANVRYSYMALGTLYLERLSLIILPLSI